MAFTKAELLRGQSNVYSTALRGCDSYWWPYSLLLRWMVGQDNKRMIKAIEKHISLDIDLEMDKITAQLKENMKNIDTLQRGKCGNK